MCVMVRVVVVVVTVTVVGEGGGVSRCLLSERFGRALRSTPRNLGVPRRILRRAARLDNSHTLQCVCIMHVPCVLQILYYTHAAPWRPSYLLAYLP